jgi:hypothetical protein
MNRHDRRAITAGLTGRERMPQQTQPQDGENVLSCGHGSPSPMLRELDNPRNPTGWFELCPPAVISGPTGEFESRWISCCSACLARAGGDVRQVTIKTHFPFAGAKSSPEVVIAATPSSGLLS